MEKMAAQRFLIYAPNGFGLGHIVRQLALARQIRKRDPRAELLFLTDCEASHLIWREGFASVKLIAFHTVERGLIAKDSAQALNRAMVASAFAAYRPDAFLVDAMPHGRSGELRGVLPNDAPSVLICREKAPEARENPRFQEALRHYDLIVLPHREGEIAFAAPEDVQVVAPGPFLIRSRAEAMARDEARQRLGLPDEGFIVFVAFGSGGDRRYRRFLDVVFAYAARFPDWTLAVLRPPYYDGDLPAGHGNRVVQFSYFPLAEAWRAFDAAITAMGNNTTTELLHNGVPSIFLPLPGTEDDHLARAARIRDADAGINLETDSKDRVLPAFEALADPATRRRIAANAARLVPDNGAERAAAMLLDWLETRGRGES